MPTTISWDFYPLIARNPMDLLVPTFMMSESELNILWHLCKKGPHSMYDLAKTRFCLPEKISGIAAIGKPSRRRLKGTKYHYPFVLKTVNRLQERNLVKALRDTSGPRTRRIAEPTFSGLMLYLQGSTERRRFDYVVENYPSLVPFSKNMKALTEFLGDGAVARVFDDAVRGCICLRRARFEIRPLQLEFRGFLRSIPSLTGSLDGEVTKRRNHKALDFLRNQDASELRNSYISYLAVHDLEKLSWKDKKQIEDLVPQLDSEKELAHFENRQVESAPLFKGDRLKELFPEYADIEFFFTGAFVNRLLWNEGPTEEEPREYNFKVEII